MNRRQFVLILLATIAATFSINSCGKQVGNANIISVKQDMKDIAAAAQGYYMKPEMMGGGSNSFGDLNWETIGTVPCHSISMDGDTEYANCINKNGTYTMSLSDKTLTITAYPSSFGGYKADQTKSKSIAVQVTANSIKWLNKPI